MDSIQRELARRQLEGLSLSRYPIPVARKYPVIESLRKEALAYLDAHPRMSFFDAHRIQHYLIGAAVLEGMKEEEGKSKP